MTKKEIIDELDSLGIKATKATSHPDLETMLTDARKSQAKAVAEERKAEAQQNDAGDNSENDAPEADQTSDTASVVGGGSEEQKSSDQDKVSTPPVETAPEMVTVKANVAIYEGGVSHAAGDEFEASEERAKALGEMVEILS